MKKKSLKDIAAAAGVSPATVSLVLNGKAAALRISKEVAEKVKRIADEEGYIPNRLAVSLRKGESKIIGVLVEDISNSFFATLARSIEDEAGKADYKVIFCSTDNNPKKAGELVQLLLNYAVDGFLIRPTPGMEDSIRQLVDMKKPVVFIDGYLPAFDIPRVLIDNTAGTSEGIEYLIQKGYRHPAMISINLPLLHMQEREQVFQKTCAEHGIKTGKDDILQLSTHQETEAGVKAIIQFLKKKKNIDALFFATNYLGIIGLQAIQELNKKIPSQMGVLCFDDTHLFRLFPPGITAIAQPQNEIASAAVDILLNLIGHKTKETPLVKTIKPILIKRGSL